MNIVYCFVGPEYDSVNVVAPYDESFEGLVGGFEGPETGLALGFGWI